MIMRAILTTFLLATLGTLLTASAATNEVLLASDYEPAEAAYRLFLQTPPPSKQGWRTNLVYCLAYGRSNSPLPADFMARFAATPLRVITDTNALLFAAGGAISDRVSGRPAVVLALRSLSLKEGHADASIRWIDSSRTVAQVFHFVKESGGWKYQGGFSTSTSSRWTP